MIITYHQYNLAVTFLSDVIMVDISTEILAVSRYYFELDLKAPGAAHRISKVERNETISDCTVLKRFRHFKGYNSSFEIKPQSR